MKTLFSGSGTGSRPSRAARDLEKVAPICNLLYRRFSTCWRPELRYARAVAIETPQPPRCRARGREQGSAVIVVMALLAILLIYLAVNIRTLSNLTRELRLIERQQTNRLATISFRTNSLPKFQMRSNDTSQVSPAIALPVATSPLTPGLSLLAAHPRWTASPPSANR